MSEYYAVIRSTDHLAHYGVKGMKWGVRKAIEKGNMRLLSRQYRKAEKKLAKLNAKADIETQSKNMRKHNRRAGVALGVGAMSLGAYGANELYARHLAGKFRKPSSSFDLSLSARRKRIVGKGKGIAKQGEGLNIGPVGNQGNQPLQVSTTNSKVNRKSGVNGFKAVHDISSAVGLVGFGTAAYQKGRALAAKYRTTKKGHERAVAKRDAWVKEMNAAFNGVNQSVQAKNKRRKRK